MKAAKGRFCWLIQFSSHVTRNQNTFLSVNFNKNCSYRFQFPRKDIRKTFARVFPKFRVTLPSNIVFKPLRLVRFPATQFLTTVFPTIPSSQIMLRRLISLYLFTELCVFRFQYQDCSTCFPDPAFWDWERDCSLSSQVSGEAPPLAPFRWEHTLKRRIVFPWLNVLFPSVTFFRKPMSLTSTISGSVISFVILFCTCKALAAGSQKIKTNEGTVYEYDRDYMCTLTPWRVESILDSRCVKKRKRVLAGRFNGFKGLRNKVG